MLDNNGYAMFHPQLRAFVILTILNKIIYF